MLFGLVILIPAGAVLSIMNVVPVELPALSVTINVFIPSVLIGVDDVYAVPFIVAPEILVSLNVSVTLPE